MTALLGTCACLGDQRSSVLVVFFYQDEGTEMAGDSCCGCVGCFVLRCLAYRIDSGWNWTSRIIYIRIKGKMKDGWKIKVEWSNLDREDLGRSRSFLRTRGRAHGTEIGTEKAILGRFVADACLRRLKANRWVARSSSGWLALAPFHRARATGTIDVDGVCDRRGCAQTDGV
jgi:hypothetical protein